MWGGNVMQSGNDMWGGNVMQSGNDMRSVITYDAEYDSSGSISHAHLFRFF